MGNSKMNLNERSERERTSGTGSLLGGVVVIMLYLFEFEVNKVLWVERAFELLQLCTILHQHVGCNTDAGRSCNSKPCRVLGGSL